MNSGQENFIRFENVTKQFGALTVLKSLDLSIRAGEKLSLIGPSGSGKTTILRILMTLESINGGAVWVNGAPLWHRQTPKGLKPADEAHLRVMRRGIGMVFQHFNLFPHMSAFENVARPPQLALGVERAEAEATAESLLAKVGLLAKKDHYPSQLSGGQKQRVAIARALAMRPEIMLFDEVTSALDPELVEEVLNTLRDISRETKMTMLMVTHEMSFAHEFSDRILFLDGGRIVEQGHPDEIFTNPREPRTQAFLKKVVAAGQRLS